MWDVVKILIKILFELIIIVSFSRSWKRVKIRKFLKDVQLHKREQEQLSAEIESFGMFASDTDEQQRLPQYTKNLLHHKF